MVADGSYLTRQPAADSRQMKSTSSPTNIPSANPAPAADRRTTSAAPGTYETRAPGRTMDGRAPMSRVELAPSYLASQEGPAWWGTIRGATAPTAGSAKCGSRRSSQSGAGTQSESRKATSSVEAAASPVFLATPGPPLTGRRITRAPYRAAISAIATGSADASSTMMTGGLCVSADTDGTDGTEGTAGSDGTGGTEGTGGTGEAGWVSAEGPAVAGPGDASVTVRRPARQRASSGCRSRTGITTVTAGWARRTLAAPESAGTVRDDGCGLKSGWARPASSRRRASKRDAALAGSGVPENQPLTWRAPAGVSRSTRTGEPPTSTRPPATNRAPGSGTSRRPAGAGAVTGAVPGSAVPGTVAAATGTATGR